MMLKRRHESVSQLDKGTSRAKSQENMETFGKSNEL